MANVPGYAQRLQVGADTDTQIMGFQVTDKTSGQANIASGKTESTRSLIEIPAVAPTMDSSPLLRSAQTPKGGVRNGVASATPGPLALNVPIGFEVS